MRPHQLKRGWSTVLADHGHAPLDLRAGLALMATFYREVRVDGAALDEDDDMLLFEWVQQGESPGAQRPRCWPTEGSRSSAAKASTGRATSETRSGAVPKGPVASTTALKDSEGEGVSVFIVRQAQLNVQDATIWQLNLRFDAPAADLKGAEDGSRWCATPDELDEFLAWCQSTVAFQEAAAAPITQARRYRVN
jgi:hypothetical protein